MPEHIQIGQQSRYRTDRHAAPAEALARYAGECRLLVMLVKAMATEMGKTDTPAPELIEQVARIIDRTLTEISNDSAKG